MMKNYDSVETCFTARSTNSKKQETKSYTISKRNWLSFWSVFLMFFSFVFVQGQTTLISPTGDGGFENGATFAANGWSVSNSTNNPWIVAPLSNGLITGNAAFVSSDGTTPSYNNGIIGTNYFWRDVTVPAGQGVIQLSFNWIANGESTWDLWQVFVAPTSVTPVGSTTYPGSGATNVPAAITGATWVANGNLQTTVQTANVLLPASLAGTTFRLIFHWKNDGSGGTTPPAQIDNISLTSRAVGDFISITNGNWSNPATWDANAVPTGLDNVTVAAHTVTIDANGQAANNLTIQGTLDFGATPTTFNVNGNLTLEAGSEFLVSNAGTTGKAVVVTGNIVNDGNFDLSVGTGTAGSLTLNGSAVQSVTGSGIFVNDVVRNLTFSNTATATPNVIWGFNNIKIANNLNITGARINLNGNKIYFGNNAVGGTFTAPVGTGFINGSFSRWWTTGATGTTITAGTDPTNATSRYPFITTNGSSRALYISRSSATTTGNTAGYLTAIFNDVAGFTTGLSIADGAYTITDRTNGNWQVSAESGYVYASGTHTLVGFYSGGMFVTSNTAARLMNPNSVVGTFQNGSTTPAAQRTGITTAQLLAEPFHIGVNSVDVPFVSVASGDWNVGTTWNKGTVPTCADNATIANGHVVTSSISGNVARNVTIATGGTLVVSAGDLTVGCTLNNNTLTNSGTLTVSGGLLAVNGNMVHNAASTFNQSGGDILVDGNEGGVAANSVASGVAIVQLNSQFINWTGGALTILDPHANATASNTIAYSNSTAHVNVPNTHTLKIGDGVSTDAGGNATNGFRINTFAGANRISFGNLEVNTLGGTNRQVTTTSNIGFNGNMTIEASSEVVFGTAYVAGNIVNNGTFTSTALLGLSSYANGTVAATTNAQTIGGTGVFRNLAAAPTANLTSLTVNNTNATGVTLNIPLSVSGTLTMTSGIINTTNTNLLTLGTTAAAGTLAGTPSVTNMIRGPFARTIANANANTNYILFPIGKVAYAPIWAAPTTTAVTIMKAETFDTNTGTQSGAISNMATNRRWELPLVSGTISDINVRLGDAGILATSIPVQAPSASGEYTSTFGALATTVVGVSTQSNTPVLSAAYTGFLSYADSNACTGAPTPGNTIASANSICLGTSVTLSLQNLTTGSGVTYQWFSSPDGVTYSPIATATNPTYTLTPTASTYFMCEVTCATGPSTTASTPVQITFANNVTATVPATRCGTGTVDLSATPSAGATINWFANETGGASLASGNLFTTPSISATTTYYAAATTAAPGFVTIGTGATLTGATAQPTAFCNRWPNYWSQTIYTAAELTAAGLSAGNITSMAYNIASLGDAATNANFTVRIGTTAGNNFANTTFLATTGYTTVYGPSTYTHTASGWQTITFATPYVWDGISNIVVNVTHDGADAINNSQTYFTATADNKVLWVNSYTGTTTTGTTSVNRLNVIFGGQAACTSARVPVVATVSSPPALTLSGVTTSICSGDSTSTVSLTAGGSDYNTFVWSPATGVSGNEIAGWTFNPTVTTTYTLTATQTSGALCASTATYTVNVNPIPSAISFNPVSPVSACENTAVAITAAGGNFNSSVFNQNMDALPANFTLVNTAGTGSATLNTTYYSEGTGSVLLTTASTSANISYQLNSNVDLTGSASASIVFSHIAAMESPTTSFDFGIIEYSTDGGSTWNLIPVANYSGSANAAVFNTNIRFSTRSYADWITTFTGTTSTPGAGPATSLWKTETVNVPAAALTSNQFRIRFRYTTDTSTNYYGWLIDNVRIIKSANNITWSPVTDLYTDAAATISYVAGTNATTVYVKSATVGSQSYTATSTDPSTGCINSNTVNVTVNALPNATITRVDDTLTAAEAGATYQWYTCSAGPVYTIIPGATSQSYTATAIGSYAVDVTKNGCTTRSACFDVTTLGSNSFDLNALQVYPNPVINTLSIKYNEEITAVSVYDLSGRLVKQITPNQTEAQVDMSELATAMYIVKVNAGGNQTEIKVVKK